MHVHFLISLLTCSELAMQPVTESQLQMQADKLCAAKSTDRDEEKKKNGMTNGSEKYKDDKSGKADKCMFTATPLMLVKDATRALAQQAEIRTPSKNGVCCAACYAHAVLVVAGFVAAVEVAFHSHDFSALH